MTTQQADSWHNPVCHRDVRVDVRRGTGRGTPLVMFSGIGVSYESFDLLVRCIDPSIEIVRIDVPGVGGSPVGMLPLGFPQLAQLVARLLDDLGYQQVDVLGFSWGGALAQQFAVQHRKRCRRVVLISTNTGLMSLPGNPRVLATMVNPQNFRNPRHAAELLSRRHNAHSAAADADINRLFRRITVSGLSLGYAYQLAAVSCWTSLPFLPLIRQPVLVMAGDDDPIVPLVNARILATLIPHASLHVYSGGHVEPLAEPADFAPIIMRFLA